MKKLFVFLLMMFLFVINVDAASLCSYQEQVELNQKSKNVKVSYEMIEGSVTLPDGSEAPLDNFEVSIMNVTEEFYVVVTNDQNSDEKTYYSYDAKDGVIKFRWSDVVNVTHFTVKVYTTNKTSCPNEVFNTVYLNLPRYNIYSSLMICNEYPDFFMCERYVEFEDVPYNVFYTQLDKYKEKKIDANGDEINNEGFFSKVIDFFKQNGLYVLGGLVVIAGVSFVIYRVTHKKQRELGL